MRQDQIEHPFIGSPCGWRCDLRRILLRSESQSQTSRKEVHVYTKWDSSGVAPQRPPRRWIRSAGSAPSSRRPTETALQRMGNRRPKHANLSRLRSRAAHLPTLFSLSSGNFRARTLTRFVAYSGNSSGNSGNSYLPGVGNRLQGTGLLPRASSGALPVLSLPGGEGQIRGDILPLSSETSPRLCCPPWLSTLVSRRLHPPDTAPPRR